jgi:hypothetical protein
MNTYANPFKTTCRNQHFECAFTKDRSRKCQNEYHSELAGAYADANGNIAEAARLLGRKVPGVRRMINILITDGYIEPIER